jgi:iron complex transport system substrate-binding protein
MNTNKHTGMIALAVLLIFSGCMRSNTAPRGNDTPRSGDTSRSNTATPTVPTRIISAAPSNTEIIIGLGFADRIVAADKYSLGIPGLPPGIAEVDFFYPDPEAIVGLAPDIIISSEHNVYGAADDPYRVLGEMGIRILYIPTSRSIADIKRDIRNIAAALDAGERGEALIRTMEQEIQEVAEMGKQIAAAPGFKPRTVYLEISPFPSPVTMGRETFPDEMIGIVVAQNIFADKTGWIAPGAEAILERNPEVILTNVNYIDNPVGEIVARRGFADIAAVREGRVYAIDTDSSSRPSHRITLALRQMARAVYPDEYAQLGENQ